MKQAPHGVAFRSSSLVLAVLAGAAYGCGDTSTMPETSRPTPTIATGDAAAGRSMFLQTCATCHASGDGYDVAAFGFSSFDVMRRSLGHLDSVSARNVTAYIESLRPVARVEGVPFQPRGSIGTTEEAFWVDAMGARDWPTGLSPEALRSIDPRELRVPLEMPGWSEESSLQDWMPDAPLPREVLDHDGGALRSGLDAYYADPTEDHLLQAVAAFEAAVEGPDRLCEDSDPVPCFDARRWMASLGGQHYLRYGHTEDVPVEVAEVWWSVGESAIALPGRLLHLDQPYEGFDRLSEHYILGARWMYLAFSFHPEAFNEPGRYMGAFLREAELDRVSVFVALRRMVGDGLAHRENPDQVLQDGLIALESSDYAVAGGVAEFVFEYYLERFQQGLPEGLHLRGARELVDRAWTESQAKMHHDTPESARVEALRDQVLDLLRD